MKTIRKAMEAMPQAEPKAGLHKVYDSGNGKIPTAEGPYAEEVYGSLATIDIPEPAKEDIVNAWCAYKAGTHNEYAVADILNKHDIKGTLRTAIYTKLGVM